MPIYEYDCPECGRFEAIQKVSDKPLKANPECNKKNCPKCAVRLMSASALQFVGSGFYKTDYCGSSSSSTKESSKSSSADSSSSSGSTTTSSGGGKKCGSGCGCH